jgi:hypothetical protein
MTPGFLLARTLPMPLPLLPGFLPFDSRNLVTLCLGREPKARVATLEHRFGGRLQPGWPLRVLIRHGLGTYPSFEDGRSVVYVSQESHIEVSGWHGWGRDASPDG